MPSPLPGTPMVWAPAGVSDTLDATTSFPGSMTALANLIPDPSTRHLWQCRPAALSVTTFAPFTAPTFVSGMLIIGDVVYGMVSTGRNAGKDEPFAYNLTSNTFTTISGVTAGNCPISPSQVGKWNPPSLALVGSKIIVSHPGFTGAGGAFFGVIDILNASAPVWSATNTTPVALIAPPQWVVQFGGRCYFLVNPVNAQPAAYLSDALNPTVITNANQILTFGDNVPLTCAAGLSLQNQLGGIIQSLMVFKGVSNIYQITGDYASATLSINTLNVATGTFSPNSVCSTEKGLIFMAPDGVRLIDFTATVSDPIGKDGQGITVPFIFALNPSRTSAAFNAGVYRIQVQDGLASGSPQQEWWYDFVREVWSGPHSTLVSLSNAYSNTFIITAQGQGAQLFRSEVQQSNTSTFVEYGHALTYNWQPAMLPDTDEMSEVSVVESTLYVASIAGADVTVVAFDQAATVLDTVVIKALGTATFWGQFQWGQALWGGLGNPLYPRQLAWTQPLVFRRLGLSATGTSTLGLKIGRLHMRYQLLGYLQQDYIDNIPGVAGAGLTDDAGTTTLTDDTGTTILTS